MAPGTGVPFFADHEAGAGRAALRGGIIAFPIVFVVAAVIGLNAGFHLVSAAGLRLFVAFWGGPGFGGMLGVTLHIIRCQLHETGTNPVSHSDGDPDASTPLRLRGPPAGPPDGPPTLPNFAGVDLGARYHSAGAGEAVGGDFLRRVPGRRGDLGCLARRRVRVGCRGSAADLASSSGGPRSRRTIQLA